MFAGIGPFAVPLAKRGVTVFANDLNPKSYEYLLRNGKRNKCMHNLNAFNMDGRDFVRWLRGDQTKATDTIVATRSSSLKPPIQFNHVVMNLPAAAVTFLDVFRGLYPEGFANLPKIHCYGFAKGNELEAKEGILNVRQ